MAQRGAGMIVLVLKAEAGFREAKAVLPRRKTCALRRTHLAGETRGDPRESFPHLVHLSRDKNQNRRLHPAAAERKGYGGGEEVKIKNKKSLCETAMAAALRYDDH